MVSVARGIALLLVTSAITAAIGAAARFPNSNGHDIVLSERGHPGMHRTAFLNSIAARWQGLDPDEYPFWRSIAAQLPGHDEDAQILAGIDLVLSGVTTIEAGSGAP